MTQHFLKSSALRDFSSGDVGDMSEVDCFKRFVEIRWGGFESIVCPQCGVIDSTTIDALADSGAANTVMPISR